MPKDRKTSTKKPNTPKKVDWAFLMSKQQAIHTLTTSPLTQALQIAKNQS